MQDILRQSTALDGKKWTVVQYIDNSVLGWWNLLTYIDKDDWVCYNNRAYKQMEDHHINTILSIVDALHKGEEV